MKDTVYVWDKLVRTLHISFVVLVTASFFSGEFHLPFHQYFGYTILLLALVRIVWGFVGSKHALFADFIKPPKTTLSHFKKLLKSKQERYLGHNPAGAMMTLLLLAMLIVVPVSGMIVYAIESGLGPLSHILPHQSMDKNLWEGIHKTQVNVLVILSIAHICGVYITSRLTSENLVRPMFTGYKRTGKDPK